MRTSRGRFSAWIVVVVSGIFAVFAVSGSFGQQTGAAPSETKSWTTAEDHQNMMQQLGIKRLRPGPSGQENAPAR